MLRLLALLVALAAPAAAQESVVTGISADKIAPELVLYDDPRHLRNVT